MAGDEAQTVRPTDFEWAWLSDLLHSSVGTPSEHKLAANLRSPQRIAGLVNRVWDLYSHIHKQERPSGTGYAEIEDDATDQILYCTAAPGPELDELLISFSAREGLALITLDDVVPAYVPEAARGAVLTVSEAKGLDFHSVCVLDPGRHVERILRDDGRLPGAGAWRAGARPGHQPGTERMPGRTSDRAPPQPGRIGRPVTTSRKQVAALAGANPLNAATPTATAAMAWAFISISSSTPDSTCRHVPAPRRCQ